MMHLINFLNLIKIFILFIWLFLIIDLLKNALIYLIVFYQMMCLVFNY